MSARQTIIRDAVYSKIAADLAASNYVINDCDLEKVYYPQETLEDLGAKPFIKVISTGFGGERNREFRVIKRLLSLPVQIAIQQRVTHTDIDHLDDLVQLTEEIMEAVEDDELVAGENYIWERTAPLKDENDLPFNYEQLTVQGVFQSIFTVFYQYVA